MSECGRKPKLCVIAGGGGGKAIAQDGGAAEQSAGTGVHQAQAPARGRPEPGRRLGSSGHEISPPLVPSDTGAREADLLPHPMVLAGAGLPTRRSVAEEALCGRYYERQRELRRIAENVDRLRYAIVDLATIELPPARLLAELDPSFDQPVIGDHLARALDCLTRFAEAWRQRDEDEPSPSA